MDILFLIIVILFLQLGLIWFQGAQYLSTKKTDLEFILNSVNFDSNKVFFDLGSGLGNVLKVVFNKYQSKCVGIERSWLLFLISEILFIGNKKITIRLGNAFTYSLNEADVVFSFLMPNDVKKLSQSISDRLKPGAVFVSPIFRPDLDNLEEINLPSGKRAYVFRKR